MASFKNKTKYVLCVVGLEYRGYVEPDETTEAIPHDVLRLWLSGPVGEAYLKAEAVEIRNLPTEAEDKETAEANADMMAKHEVDERTLTSPSLDEIQTAGSESLFAPDPPTSQKKYADMTMVECRQWLRDHPEAHHRSEDAVIRRMAALGKV